MERDKIKLNNSISVNSSNTESMKKILLDGDNRQLPYNDIVRIINENEVFNDERRRSNRFRIVCDLNRVISNPLFNVSGDNSWDIFNKPLFRDRSYPPNEISVNEEEDFSYKESIDYHLREVNGWFGYYNPKINESSRMEFKHMWPGRQELDIMNKNILNWDLSFVYPYKNDDSDTYNNGLPIIDTVECNVGGKNMVGLGSPHKHNLSLYDNIIVFIDGEEKTYTVKRLGLDNGDFKDNYLVVDEQLNFFNNKVVSFKKYTRKGYCKYYLRRFKRINTVKGVMGDQEYDLSPLAFSKNIFGDQILQLITKNDIDLTNLTDNLGRPLSKMYLMLIKRKSEGFTEIKSGFKLNNINNIDNSNSIHDICRIHNGNNSHIPLDTNLSFHDNDFIGDLVEYNPDTLLETILSEVHHRFNTQNRELDSTIVIKNNSSTDSSIGNVPYQVENNDLSDILNGGDVNLSYNPIVPEIRESSLTLATTSNNFNYKRISLLYPPQGEYISPCMSQSSSYFYIDGETFKDATIISRYSDGSSYAGPNEYSDGNYVRVWDGTKFTSTELCAGSSIGCNNFRGVSKVVEGGTRIGGFCLETSVDTEGFNYYIKGKYFYRDRFAGGSNTSCNSVTTSRVGTIVNSFNYNLSKITANEDEEIRLISNNFIVNDKSYTLYVKWDLSDSYAPKISSPYFICNETTEVIDENDNDEGEYTEENKNIGGRQEGYYYKPFYEIKLKDISSYIEEGDVYTNGIPEYATQYENGTFRWREVLDIGVNSDGVDHPFLNNAHHIYTNIIFPLKRQDPFGEIGLRSDGEFGDIKGDKISDDHIIKESGDVC